MAIRPFPASNKVIISYERRRKQLKIETSGKSIGAGLKNSGKESLNEIGVYNRERSRGKNDRRAGADEDYGFKAVS